MANQIKYQVKFDVQQSSLNQLKTSLQEIKKINLNDIMKINNTDLNAASTALRQVQQDAEKVENALSKAFNAKLNTFNIQTFNKELASSNLTIAKVQQSFSRAGTAGQSAFNNLAAQVLNTNVQLRQSNKLLDSMATSMANTIKWGITSSIFNNMTRSIQSAYYYAKDLDQSLTDIRIVTGDSADQMERFAQTANSAAKDLGRSTLDYTKAALTFYQQGLSDDEVQARTEATLKAENITGAGAEMADYLTAVWNGFKVGAEDAEEYVDKLAAVADSTASNMGQLATAISKVASAASNVGVDIDQLNGQIATVIATTRQAPESVGVAFKTIYARINDIKAGTDEAEISLGNYSSKMAQLGFNVLDASGHLRDTGEVIEEIGGSWENLTREQQIYLAQTMAGQRQYNNLIALFDNWDQYLQSVNTSMEAQGTLNEKNDRYLESLEAHMQQLGTEAERTYDILFDENTVKGFVDSLGDALNTFNDFISGLGGGKNAFIYFGSLITNIFNKQIAHAIQGAGAEINRFFANFQAFNAKQNIVNQIKSGLQTAWAGEGKNLGNEALTMQATAAQKTLAVQRGLTAEQQKQAVQVQKQIGLSQQKINDLQRQDQKAKDIVKTLQQKQVIQGRSIALLQQDQQQLQLSYNANQKSLTVMEGVERSLERINSGTLSWQQQGRISANITQQIRNQSANLEDTWIAAGGSAKEFQNHLSIIEGYLNGQITDSERFRQSWEAIKNTTQQYANSQKSDLAIIDEYLQNIGIDTSKLTEEERKRLAILLKQNDALAQQGENTIKLQTGIRAISAVSQALTAISGGISTALADGATAADKLNGSFSAINGSIAAALTMIPGIGPAIGMAWHGVAAIGKSLLQATGIWDKWEDHFKSAQQRINELNDSINKVNQNDKTKDAQIGNLESLVEEYEILSSKAGDYGVNLDKLTQQQKNRYHEITDTFAEYNKAVIVGYDEQGHAIVRGQDALKDTIEVLKQAKLQADKAALGDKDTFLSNIGVEQNERYESGIRQVQQSKNKIISDGKNGNLNKDISLEQQDSLTSQLSLLFGDVYKESANLSQDLQNELSRINENLNQQLLEGAYTKVFDSVRKLAIWIGKARNELKDTDLFNQYDDFLRGFFTQEEQELLDSLDAESTRLAQEFNNATYSQEAANKILTGLQIFDNNIWSTIEDGLSEMGIGSQHIIQALSDSIMGTKISEADASQLYEDIRQQAQDYAGFVTDYGNAIQEATSKAATDMQSIFDEEEGPKTAKELHNTIENSIRDTLDIFLNDTGIRTLLKEHPEYAQFLESLLEDLYDVNDVEIAFAKRGGAPYLKAIKTEKEKINQDIIDAIFSEDSNVLSEGSKKSPITQTLFKSYLQNLDVDDDTLLAIKGGLTEIKEPLSSLLELQNWVNDFIIGVDKQTDADSIIEKFDKVSNAIQKIQDGKQINWKERGNLKQALNLTDEELAGLNTNADWLQKITEKIYGSLNPENTEESAARKDAFASLYTTLDALDQAYNKSEELYGQNAMTPEQYNDTWQIVYQNQLDALQLTQEQLADYAETKHMAFDSPDAKKEVLNLYKNVQVYNKLGTELTNLKDKVENFKGTAEDAADSEFGEQLLNILTLLRQLGAGDIDMQWLLDNFAMLEAAAQGDIEAFQALLNQGQQLSAPKESKQSSADKYRGIQSTSTNLSGAYDALSTGKELTDEQSTALNQLILKNEQLAELSREQGINSQAFLKVLQLIVQATEQEAIEAGKIAIQELKAKQARLSEQINSVGTKTEDIRAAEKLSNWERQLQETTAQRLAIEQQLTIEWQKQADVAQNIDQLESAKLAGMDENTFEKNLDAAAGREAKSLGLDEDEVLDYATALQECADQSDDLADSLENDRDASLQLAIAGKRLTRGIKDLTQNFDKYNQQINSDNIEEQAQGFGHLRDAMGDILNIDGNLLTKGFLTDNLQDMKLAAEGDIDAIDRLRQAAADDIIQQCLVKLDGSEQVQAKLLNLSNQIESFLSQDIQLGVNLDDSDFIAKCNKLITEAGMTQDQIQAYFNSLGFDPKISYIPTNSLPVESTTEGTVNVAGLIDIPYTMTATSTTKVQVPRIESLTKIGGGAHSGAITNAPAPSSSGGKGRGGGGGKGKSPKKGGGSKKSGKTNKKDLEKPIEDQRDIYHDINIQLSQLERNFDRIQKDQEKLYGKQLLDNLNKQQKLLDKQIETLRRKQKLQEQDLANQKQKLRGLGVEVNEQGDIINYMDALGQKQDKVNSLIAEENALIQKRNKLKNKEKQDALDQLIEKKKKEVDAAKDDLDKTENAIKDYDDLRNDMEDLIDDIEDLIDQQIEINIEKFNAKVEMTLELGQAEREWNEFRRNVLENKDFMIRTDFDDIFAGLQQNVDDFYSYFDVHGSIGGIETLTQHLHDIQKEINDIDEKGQSAIYGKNKAKAMEDLQNNLDKLMDQMENIEKISEDIDKAYLDTIDDIEEHFSKQGQEYEYVNDLIQHDMDLLSLLYGDKNYAAMNNYYETLRKHNLDQLDSLKLQKDFWKEQMENALNQGDTKAAEKFRENYKNVIQDLNSLVKDSVETLRDQYSNVIEEIFDDLDKKVSNGHGTDYLSDQWDLMNKNADEYLDNINSAFAIQQTERKYQNAINDTKNIKNQQALKKLMDQQLDILKDKEKLTQYDVDRAEKLLQVEQARIALQDARAAKTTMRLKRDAQGNYSYEYAADEDAIGQAEANLAAAQNDLYNFDKDHYKSNLDDILSAWKDFQQEYKDIVLDTSLTEEARVEKIALLRDQYGEYINGKLSENKNIRGNLMDSAFKDYAKLYNNDVENYKNMTDAQKQILMQNLVPAWNSGIQQMADKIAGEDGLVGVCEQAFKDIAEASDSYQTNVDELSKVSGLNFDDLKQGRDEIIDTFKETIQKNQDLITTIGQEITSVQSLRDNVQSLKEKYDELAEAAKTALTQGHDALQEYRKAQLEVFSNPEMAEVLSHENSSNGQDQITESLDQEIENINTWQTINKGESIDYEPLKQNSTGKISSYIKSINSFVKSDIASLIKQIQIVPAGLLNLLTDLDNNNNNNIEQTVYIDANFPNVDDWQDIIDAFSDIENKAIQKTMQ